MSYLAATKYDVPRPVLPLTPLALIADPAVVNTENSRNSPFRLMNVLLFPAVVSNDRIRPPELPPYPVGATHATYVKLAMFAMVALPLTSTHCADPSNIKARTLRVPLVPMEVGSPDDTVVVMPRVAVRPLPDESASVW